MLIRRCVCLKSILEYFIATSSPSNQCRVYSDRRTNLGCFSGSKPFFIFILLYALFLFLLPTASEGRETLILNVTLNQEIKGDFFIVRTDDGDFLIKIADIKAMGFREPEGNISEIDGELYISLKSMKGVDFFLNEKTLSLEITAHPGILLKRTIDFLPKRQPKVYYPKDNSAFLNYRLDYSAGNSFAFQGFNLTNQIGARVGDFLFLTDTYYKKTPVKEKFIRLMSNITYDRRQDLQRLILGDFFAFSGDLGGRINMGGISFSKVYHIDPYFIKNPMYNFSGLASLPSEVEVYLDGMLIRKEKLPPGEFELKNISYYGGARTVEIVIKDPFGREQRFVHPFYFTDIPLRKGFHEYSYNVGFLREEFGVESDKYSELALSAFHRYGLSDSLTIGFRTEAKKGLYNFGPQASYTMPRAGIIKISLSSNITDMSKSGFAGSFEYGYQGRKINARLLLRLYSRDYANLLSDATVEKVKYEAGAGIGYVSREFGSISFDITRTKKI